MPNTSCDKKFETNLLIVRQNFAAKKSATRLVRMKLLIAFLFSPIRDVHSWISSEFELNLGKLAYSW